MLIVGAGPTGLVLAAELALAGVRCRILERRGERSRLTKAFGVNARTMELLDMRGLADDVLRSALRVPGMTLNIAKKQFHADFHTAESRFPIMVNVAQQRTEHVLADRVADLGVDTVWNAELVGLGQDADGVAATVAGPGGSWVERASYVVGCDGAHSRVRDLVGVPFSGATYDTHIMLADVVLGDFRGDEAITRTYLGRDGIVVFGSFQDGWTRVVIWDAQQDHVPIDEPVSARQIRESLRRIADSDLGMTRMRWSTRFLGDRRLAGSYRRDRVFLAGDAAHVFSPFLGLGMNTGIQDAMNLGWKLAAEVNGWSPPGLLASYQDERLPLGRQAMRVTDIMQRVVVTPSALMRPIRRVVWPLLMTRPRARSVLTRQVAGIATRYPPWPARDGAHPWVGRRVPDAPVGASQLYQVLRSGRFVLLDHTSTGAAARAAAAWGHRVDPFHLPDPPPDSWPAVTLIRPDGHVAWASSRPPDPDQVHDRIRRWCGYASTVA